jgi:hypothetical protein
MVCTFVEYLIDINMEILGRTSAKDIMLKDRGSLGYPFSRRSNEMNNTNDNESYYEFLDALRLTGVTNMFGATPYLMEAFPELTKLRAAKILASWMNTFVDRHPNG